MRRCTRSSTTSSEESAPTSTGAGCTRRWCSGRPWAPDRINPAVSRDYAEIWRSAQKIVYSRSLSTPSSAKTRIEAEFDPAVIRTLKEASSADITIGGPALAGQAIAAGLVDECHLF